MSDDRENKVSQLRLQEIRMAERFMKKIDQINVKSAWKPMVWIA
jgi:hypothetical protein